MIMFGYTVTPEVRRRLNNKVRHKHSRGLEGPSALLQGLGRSIGKRMKARCHLVSCFTGSV